MFTERGGDGEPQPIEGRFNRIGVVQALSAGHYPGEFLGTEFNALGHGSLRE